MAAWNNGFLGKNHRGGPFKTSSRLMQQWVKKRGKSKQLLQSVEYAKNIKLLMFDA